MNKCSSISRFFHALVIIGMRTGLIFPIREYFLHFVEFHFLSIVRKKIQLDQ
jgi:hypothetical protein